MSEYKKLLWLVFSDTGEINDYLKYKFFEKDLEVEVGEELGIDKDLRDSSEDNEIR